MSKKEPFTPEQIAVLEANKYTHSVSPQRIIFTLEFKEFFVQQAQEGKKAPAILRMAGYDPGMFKRGNIDAIRMRILAEARSEKGLQPPRGMTNAEKIAAFAKKDLKKQQLETTVTELQERITHLEYQIEFLKKTAALREKRMMGQVQNVPRS